MRGAMKKGWILMIVTLFSGLTAEEGTVRPTVVLETNYGEIVVELFPEVAPKACENFTQLVEKGYYNGVTFHRVIPDFMIQGGDPTGTGAGGESSFGAPFQDECSPKVRFDRPGLLAMANRGPNTNGSQFFITVAPTPWLQGKHTIFGQVKEGSFEVVQKISKCATDSQNRPKEAVKILKAHSLLEKVDS